MKKRYRNRTNVYGSIIAGGMVSAFAIPNVVLAQTADATLRGTAPASSTITAKNQATGYTRHTTASADGSYVIAGLPPGTYRIDAGAGTETTVTLLVASTSDVDLTKSLEEVIVTGARGHTTKTSEVASVVSLHDIETTPQITRNFLEFADTVPGMVFQIDSNGVSSLRGGAMNTSGINVFIDGVGQKDYVLNGGASGQDNTQGNPFPQLAIAEYKVVTSNYKAEYGQVSSAAIIAETKSGTNAFHGQVFGNLTNENLRALTPSEVYNHQQVPSKNNEFGFAIGGPIIQDKMHFFLTYEGKKYSTPKAVSPRVTGLESILPPEVVAQFGPADQDFNEDLIFGKLDWEPSESDRFELQSKWRNEKQVGNVGGSLTPDHGIDKKTIDKRIVARWQHNADRWLNDLQLTYEDVVWKSVPRTSGGNGRSYDLLTNVGTLAAPDYHIDNIIQSGAAGPGDLQDKGQSGNAIQDDLTFTNLHWYGDHTLKAGVLIKKVKLHAQDAGNADPQFSFLVDATGEFGSATPYLMSNPYQVSFSKPSLLGISNVSESKNTQIGIYFQDDWQATDRLVIYPGIRWDYESIPKYLDWKTPQDVLAAFDLPADPNDPNSVSYRESLALGGINLNDYISTGNNRKAITNEFAPRLGFALDLTGDKRHVLTGGIGRSYDRDLYNYMQLEQNKSALGTPTLNFDVVGANGTGPACLRGTCTFPWSDSYLNGIQNLQALVSGTNVGVETDMLPNKLKAPYSDQISLGIRSRVGDWTLSETVAYIHGKDGFAWLLGNRYPDGAFWLDGGQAWGNGVPGFNSALILGTNGIESKNTQLLVEIAKPYTEESRWGTNIALTLSSAKANYSMTSVFPYALNFPTLKNYRMVTADSVSKWRLVATGSVKGPWNVVYAGKFTLAAPTSYFAQNVCLGVTQPYPETGFTCTNFNTTVSNTIGYSTLDLNATKTFEIGKSMSAYIKADFLNVLNHHNYDINYSLYADGSYYGSGGHLNNPALRYDPNGNILGWPRTVKVELGFKF